MKNQYIHVCTHSKKYSLHVMDVKKLWKVKSYPTPRLPSWDPDCKDD